MTVSDKSWGSFSQADYTPEQWKAACLIHMSDSMEKADHKLPVKEPSGAVNRNGCHAAASRINQVDAPADKKKAAASALVSLYRNQLKEDPPDSLLKLAGRSERLVSRMSNVFEKRSNVLEIRLGGTAEAPVFEGRAIVYNTWTEIGDTRSYGFLEKVAPGSLTKTLNEGDARFLVDHDSSKLVARKSSGDLRLRDTADGVDVDADLDMELSYVRDMAVNVRKRRMTGMSFGFNVVRDSWGSIDVEENGETHAAQMRTLQELRLAEVSVVTFPAYPTTEAALRSMVDEIRSSRLGDGALSASELSTREAEKAAEARASQNRLEVLLLDAELLGSYYKL